MNSVQTRMFEQALAEHDFEWVRMHAHLANWNLLSQDLVLDEAAISEFADILHWGYVSRYQSLSEDNMRRFAGRLDWNLACIHQKMSEDVSRVHEGVRRLDFALLV